MMSNILILSHTQGYSDFKIGSHHYANGLSKLGHEIYYSGMPKTIFHRLLGKRNSGTYKLDGEIKNLQLGSIFPLTLPMGVLTNIINPISFLLFKNNKKIKEITYQAVICDSPFFFPMLKNIRYEQLFYRPTDNYVAMVGEKAKEYEREICEISKTIICTSQSVADNIALRYSTDESKIMTITNGYDSEQFFRIHDDNKRRSNALYIGALDYRFDFDALYQLAIANKDIVFDIYGPIEKKYNNSILEIQNLGNVFFHGKVDYLKTNEIMNKYKVGLLLLKKIPSNLGRSPMKLWEYLASGLNVIYANIDNIEACEYLFKYENNEEMLNNFKIANIYNNDIKNDFLEKNSWRKKTMELNVLII